MKIISAFLALAKPPTIADDAEFQAEQAIKDIAQSEATILRAAYIKHLAEWKLKAIADWSNKTQGTLDPESTAFNQRYK